MKVMLLTILLLFVGLPILLNILHKIDLKSKSFLHTCLIYSGGWMVVCVIISILDWLEDGEYVEWYELLGWCVIPPLLYCLIQYTKGSKFVSDSNRKIMNKKQLDNLDAWKDYVLKVIIERGDATLKDYVWDRIEQEFHLDADRIHHYRYTDSVLPCLENEFELIRTSGKNGIQITEKGKKVAKIGFRSYVNSLERHERIQKWNDYLGLVTGSLSIITTLVGFANMFIGWIDKFTAFIPAAILTILFAAIKFLCKIRK